MSLGLNKYETLVSSQKFLPTIWAQKRFLLKLQCLKRLKQTFQQPSYLKNDCILCNIGIRESGWQRGIKLEFYPSNPGSTPAWVKYQKKNLNHVVCLIMTTEVGLKAYFKKTKRIGEMWDFMASKQKNAIFRCNFQVCEKIPFQYST